MDDFQNSTQLAFLIGRPIVGFDIINSQTSPNTIVFIHTEMSKSKVVNLKNHIKNEGNSVFRLADSNQKESKTPEFNKRIKEARRSFENAKQLALFTKKSSEQSSELNKDKVSEITIEEDYHPKGQKKSELAMRVEKARNNYESIKKVGLLKNHQANVLAENENVPAKKKIRSC